MDINGGFLTPEIVEALVALITALTTYGVYLLRQSVKQMEKITDIEQPKEVPKEPEVKTEEVHSGSVALYNEEFQTPEGLQATLNAIPAGAEIIKIDEGVASNGSKYKIIYWKVRR